MHVHNLMVIFPIKSTIATHHPCNFPAPNQKALPATKLETNGSEVETGHAEEPNDWMVPDQHGRHSDRDDIDTGRCTLAG